ncbi:hypothetical protein BDQ12DRAFT_681925 [Crucibulum laeve]|uniref:Uncharacterized protein n=1 Tax=Crucibulum laeve TaxID=68775 RepID=A0A5C3M2C9_9AGAR|nr:hypothetical protein BDQ12DRAFT_681925 [Crucibulum laeve]
MLLPDHFSRLSCKSCRPCLYYLPGSRTTQPVLHVKSYPLRFQFQTPFQRLQFPLKHGLILCIVLLTIIWVYHYQFNLDLGVQTHNSFLKHRPRRQVSFNHILLRTTPFSVDRHP